MRRWLTAICALMIMCLGSSVLAADLPKLRLAALKFGTVMWELETIRQHGLDRQNGFQLDIRPVAGKQAAAVMLQAGEADAIVSDWLWAARQWPAGRRFLAVPYSKAVGGVIVPKGGVKTLGDLDGKRIGIAGGALDKNWLILRAVTKQAYGFDLAQRAEAAFASPPIIYRKMLTGEFDAAINFWHFQARARAAGLGDLVTVDDLVRQAGLSPDVPLLAYVFSQAYAEASPAQVAGFARASRAAKNLLRDNDQAWQGLKPMMKAKTDTVFRELRAGYLAGIPGEAGWPELSKMQAWVDFMRDNGGGRLIGPLKTVPVGLFYRP